MIKQANSLLLNAIVSLPPILAGEPASFTPTQLVSKGDNFKTETPLPLCCQNDPLDPFSSSFIVLLTNSVELALTSTLPLEVLCLISVLCQMYSNPFRESLLSGFIQ